MIPSSSRVSLAQLFPRPVPLTLAGRTYLVGQLQVADLIELDHWLMGRAAHPLEGIPPADQDPDPATRRRRLREARDRAQAWPPRVGNDEGDALLATPEGTAAYVCLVLTKHNPDFDPGLIGWVAAEMEADDWARLDRIAWGTDPLEDLYREVEPERFERRADPPDWEAQYCALARKYPGLTFEAFGNLTLSQLDCLRRDGVARSYALVGRERGGLAGVRATWRRWYLDDEWDAEKNRPRANGVAH